MNTWQAQAETLRADMIDQRRDLHRHPELAFAEVRTAGIVAEALNALGLEVQTGVGQTGVIGLLEGSQPGPVVLVRCDMDALPINEENDTSYRSQSPGRMHACGHDGHTAIALAVAQMLNSQRERLRGTVKFVFQPAEEIGRGADAMIADGALDDPRPDVCYGLHLWNDMPRGQVAVTAGPFMAGADGLHISLHGRGSHAALPQHAADPIVAAAALIMALQTVVSRSVPPLETVVVSVTQVQAGTALNIIPEQVTLAGTIRTFKPDVRALVIERVRALAASTAAAYGCQAEVTVEQLSQPVMNDVALAERLLAHFRQHAPTLEYVSGFQTMAAEDVSAFLERVPGVFFFVGSADAARGLDYSHHHPRFDFDEEALVTGAALLAQAVAAHVLSEG
jgi:amidohydrolase